MRFLFVEKPSTAARGILKRSCSFFCSSLTRKEKKYPSFLYYAIDGQSKDEECVWHPKKRSAPQGMGIRMGTRVFQAYILVSDT